MIYHNDRSLLMTFFISFEMRIISSELVKIELCTTYLVNSSDMSPLQLTQYSFS